METKKRHTHRQSDLKLVLKIDRNLEVSTYGTKQIIDHY